jgi:glycerol-3-phosphate acyltransferase PlsY
MAVGVLALAYLLGSIPSAYIAGRLKGVGIQGVGGRNPGALNVWREVGRVAGVVVLLVDVGKGAVAVLIAQWLGLPYALVLLAGLAAVLGHDFSAFLRFKGGKGAATTMGVLLVLVPHPLLIALGICSIVVLITRNVTLGLAVQFIALPILLWQMSYPGLLVGYSAALPIISGMRHIPILRQEVIAKSKRELIFDRWQRRKK